MGLLAWAYRAGIELLAYASSLDPAFLLENKWARGLGMLALVWATIWIIALVYSGYARDSEIGPVGIRPHTNRRLGEETIVFDQNMFPFQMHGVEATCKFYFVYDDWNGKRRRIPLETPRQLRLNIRASLIPKDTSTRYGFEGPDDLASDLVIYPTFDPETPPPQTVHAMPPTVGEYVRSYDLERKWTDDDEAPIVSLGQSQWELITDARDEHIRAQAARLERARKGNWLQRQSAPKLARERANVFGSYYLRMQFPRDPTFVLFKHPNKELKMTAWLTLLTSIFALAMDAWPVDYAASKEQTRPPAFSNSSEKTPSAGGLAATRRPNGP